MIFTSTFLLSGCREGIRVTDRYEAGDGSSSKTVREGCSWETGFCGYTP